VLSPDDITSRSFLVSLRGYDRDEVHAFLAQVADAVRDREDRIGELEELATAPAEPATPAEAPPAESAAPEVAAPTSPSELFAEIGRETQRILEAAQAAGDDLRRHAEEEAAQLRTTTQEETDALRASAEEETAELRRTTKEATDREIKAARAEATKIIADGERRLESLEQTLAELTAARDALAGSIRDVGRSVERTLRDLVADDEPTTTMREAVTASVRQDAAPAEVAEAAEAEPAESEPDPEPEEHGAADADVAADVPTTSDTDELPLTPAAGEDEGGAEEASEATPTEPLPAELVEEAQALRAAGLAPLHPKLVRKLKRGLQDLQNGMLDRLRRADAKGEADTFLPDYTAIATLSALSEEFLTNAWWAGTASGEALADEEVEAPEPAGGLAEELTSALADQLMAQLATGLQEGLGAQEDIVGLGERIGAIFSAVKEAPVEELAALALLRTYEEGLHAAWATGSTSGRHWALAAEPPCEDPRCADNNRAGAVPLATPFPSGQMNPPVRVGCNCTTVPATR
jgi:DivIVA domain-containing protein